MSSSVSAVKSIILMNVDCLLNCLFFLSARFTASFTHFQYITTDNKLVLMYILLWWYCYRAQFILIATLSHPWSWTHVILYQTLWKYSVKNPCQICNIDGGNQALNERVFMSSCPCSADLNYKPWNDQWPLHWWGTLLNTLSVIGLGACFIILSLWSMKLKY